MVDSVSDAARQTDELEVLKAVYGEEHVRVDGSNLKVLVSEDFVIRLQLPKSYPSTVAPIVVAGGVGVPTVADCTEIMNELFIKDEEVLLKWIEAVREVTSDERQTRIDQKQASEAKRTEAQKRFTVQPQQLLTNENDTELDAAKFFTGITITANKSKFVAHAARCRTNEEAAQLIGLVRLSKFARATHNIWAYRFADGRADNDDDGESAAGGRLAELLHLINAKDVLVVVSRFYGGVNVGPQRFKYILQTARDAIDRIPK